MSGPYCIRAALPDPDGDAVVVALDGVVTSFGRDRHRCRRALHVGVIERGTTTVSGRRARGCRTSGVSPVLVCSRCCVTWEMRVPASLRCPGCRARLGGDSG